VKPREEILAHLAYGLKHLDGLRWLCELLQSDSDKTRSFRLDVSGAPVIARDNFECIQIALAEAGLISFRRTVEFLGLQLDARRPMLRAVCHPRTHDDDAGIEDLGLPRVRIDDLDHLDLGKPSVIEWAFIDTLQIASKGVAHFTVGEQQGATFKPVLLCTQVTLMLVETHVYGKLGIKIPPYAIWRDD